MGSFHYWEVSALLAIYSQFESYLTKRFEGGVPLPTNLFKSELIFQKLAPQSISQSEALLQWKG